MNKFKFTIKYFSPTDFVLSMSETESSTDYQTAEEIASILVYANNSGGLTQYFENLFNLYNCDFQKSYLIVGDLTLKKESV